MYVHDLYYIVFYCIVLFVLLLVTYVNGYRQISGKTNVPNGVKTINPFTCRRFTVMDIWIELS